MSLSETGNKARIEVQIDAPFSARVSVELFALATRATLRHQGVEEVVGLTIVVTGDETIRQLNRSYRGLDAPSDVLSFGNEEADGFVTPAQIPLYLGDVILSFPRAQAQAAHEGHPLEAELQLLTVHGVLHLLGHDHADPDQKADMWSAQTEILRDLGWGA